MSRKGNKDKERERERERRERERERERERDKQVVIYKERKQVKCKQDLERE